MHVRAGKQKMNIKMLFNNTRVNILSLRGEETCGWGVEGLLTFSAATSA